MFQRRRGEKMFSSKCHLLKSIAGYQIGCLTVAKHMFQIRREITEK
jgi:hypothetical protein